MMSLQVEIAYFNRHRDEWLAKYRGQFVAIRQQELGGFFDTDESAYEFGIDRWGNVPMLIRQVLPAEPVAHIPAITHGLLNAHIRV